MREGFTTGSCAAAAAKAAAYMLISGMRIGKISIKVPRGEVFETKIHDITIENDRVCCAVKKDAGDDPDVTDGVMVYAEVKKHEGYDRDQRIKSPGSISTIDNASIIATYEGENGKNEKNSEVGYAERPDENIKIYIEGGEGVGRITKPGLDRDVGEAAINSVPRQMIKEGIMEVMTEFTGMYDLDPYREKGIDVTISVPGGEEIAKKTFNPRLGIEGGISIIGTSGIVEPMSKKALTDTIYVELRQYRKMHGDRVVVSPGNYGRKFLKEKYGYDIDKAVKCSNFIGDTIDMCVKLGFKEILICGHVGKMIKLGAGIMNTHSREADGRMEVLAAACIRNGMDNRALNRILDCVSVTEALGYLRENRKVGINKIMSTIMDRIRYYIDIKCDGRIRAEFMLYSEEFGLLGATRHAEEMLK